MRRAGTSRSCVIRAPISRAWKSRSTARLRGAAFRSRVIPGKEEAGIFTVVHRFAVGEANVSHDQSRVAKAAGNAPLRGVDVVDA